MTAESPQPPLVLLVEADPNDAQIVSRAFVTQPAHGLLRVVDRLDAARAFLQHTQPDIAVIDLNLPDGRGSELLAGLGNDPPFPAVVMTARGDEAVAAEVMRAGALDYVIKDDATLADMPHIVARSLRQWRALAERESARNALLESERRYRALVDHAYDFIAELDENGNILSASPNHLELTGRDPAELCGTNALTLLHPRDRKRPADRESLEREGGLVLAPMRWRHVDGSSRLLETALRTYRTASNERRTIAISRDLTERIELEEQLRQAQKMDAVGQLAGGIAHDFNNLLTIITGHAEQLLDRIDPDDGRRESAVEIQSAANRAAALTRQILAFSQSQMLIAQEVDVNTLITDLGKMLWRLIGEDIRLSVQLHSAVGRIRADPSQLEQLVVNLAVNARDAMPDGGLLTIATSEVPAASSEMHADADARTFVRIRISDTGTGMDEETRGRIFDPFFTTKEPGSGTGLGLATVYGIVRNSGGRIRVHSTPGEGTEFEVDFPRLEQPEAVLQTERAAAEEPAHGDETVLLVEDDDAVRALLQRGLEQLGYRVIAARSGSEAQARAETEPGPVDVLVTDLVMPEMGGNELAARLTTSRPELRVVVMSGYTDGRSALRLRIPPHAALLRKPFRPGELAGAIREALDG